MGGDKYSSIIHTLSMNFQPVFLTSATTIIGFLCLNTSDVPPYRFLGVTSALGVGACFILTFTFLPAFLAIAPIKISPKQAIPISQDDRWLSLGHFLVRNKTPASIVTMLSILVTVPFIWCNKVDDRLITYFDSDAPFRSHSEFTMENIAPFYTIFYSFSS